MAKDTWMSSAYVAEQYRLLHLNLKLWSGKFSHFSAIWKTFDAKVFLLDLNGQWGEGELRGPLVLLIHYCKDGGGGEGGEGGRGSQEGTSKISLWLEKFLHTLSIPKIPVRILNTQNGSVWRKIFWILFFLMNPPSQMSLFMYHSNYYRIWFGIRG